MDINPYQPPQAEILVSTANSEAEVIRKAHLSHEASVKSAGTLYLIGALMVLMIGIGSVGTASISQRGHIGFPEIVLWLVLLGIGLIPFWIGRGLRKLQPWARIPAALLSGVGLLGFPVGTVINAYIMYLVLCKKGQMVLSPEYKQIIEQTPHIKYKTSIVVWILLGLILLIIGIGVLAAFMG